LIRSPWIPIACLALSLPVAAAPPTPPKPFASGLQSPESAVVGMDGRSYVTVIGEFGKDGDGGVVVLDGDKAVPFVTGLDDPKGIVTFMGRFFVTDKTRVWAVDPKGKKTILAAAEAFPTKPQFLNDITADEKGTLYVSDSGDLMGGGGAIFRIDQKGKVMLVADAAKNPALKTPNGLLHDSFDHLLFVDFTSGELHRMKIADGTSEKLADGFGGGDGLIWDRFGRLFISDWKNGKVFVIGRPGAKPVLVAEGFQAAADLCLDKTGRFILVPDMKAGTMTALPAQVPGAEVDDTPLALKSELAFPDLEWTDWQSEVNGKKVPLRPIALTHAGDGSNRVFIATQHGVVHVLPDDPKATKTKVFLDMQDKVFYSDRENEQGLLGLAFHPKYKQNGEFFVFYTVKTPRLTNVVCRYRVSKADPDKADPASEEELLRVDHKYWNHDGGTVCFGPDGFLYVIHGDGGQGGDPQENGQNLNTLYGKIVRIDIDKKDEGKNYAIPKDNPFVGKANVRPEIWAYGIRNIWRMSFDAKTGTLWCGEVGQNLWEEINLIVPGGNYGWNIRESLHPFGKDGVGPRPDLVDPIWEYHHDLGKSITGGHVYRGSRLPELDGHYLYADYVTNKLWALKYDPAQKRVVANRPIPSGAPAVMSFGEDEKGEVYFMTHHPDGKGVFRLTRTGK
jgi:glucose/arabinose dehydrogenase